jgi:hypothetical protein
MGLDTMIAPDKVPWALGTLWDFSAFLGGESSLINEVSVRAEGRAGDSTGILPASGEKVMGGWSGRWGGEGPLF